MQRVMGPVLYFRGCDADLWRLAALVALPEHAGPEPLRPDAGEPVRPLALARHDGTILWRYDFALPLAAQGRDASYRIGAESWTVRLPGFGGGLRLAYTACNGDDTGKLAGRPAARNERWRHLHATHRERPFHLLLQGGDQFYADGIWEAVPALGRWSGRPRAERLRAPFGPELARTVRDFYMSGYLGSWAQPELAPILAGIPSLMMWDDHDIFDGYGSHPDDMQASPTFRGIWAEARDSFALFQLAAHPDGLPDGFAQPAGRHFGWSYRIGPVGIIAPDLRSLRSTGQILDEAAWADFVGGLESLAGCRHLLLMSSVPLVNAELWLMEKIMVSLPGHQDFQDDLRDQWQSFAHRAEWQRMIACLVEFAERTGARITSVSGEIHLGALGWVGTERTRIHQLTSSGIVHPPPPAFFVRFLEWGSRRASRVDGRFRFGMLEMPGAGRRYLRARNWLALDVDADGALAAAWHSEGAPNPTFAVPAAAPSAAASPAPASGNALRDALLSRRSSG